MLRSFLIRNFRGFRDLALDGLERVNLIAGRNNTGKTSLLEAIYLFANPDKCDLAVEINRGRGLTEVADSARSSSLGGEQTALGDLCGWLFHDGNQLSPALLEGREEEGRSRSIELHLADPATAQLEYPEIMRFMSEHFPAGWSNDKIPRIVYRYRGPDQKEAYSAFVTSQFGLYSLGLLVPDSPGDRPHLFHSIPSRLLGSCLNPPARVAEEFSRIEALGDQEIILSALRIIEPRLRRLSLLVMSGKTELHGDIGLKRLMPVSFMGEGMRRLLSIVLAIANCPGGAVLIDEVENGLHHSVLEKVWEAISLAARRADAQVFATTHSYECIRAAHAALAAAEPYDLRLLRLVRTDDRIKAVAYDEEALGTSVEMNLEVR
jgi:hypothetical protein